MVLQSFIVRQLIMLGARAVKTKGVRTLGKQLLKELTPGGSHHKAVAIASKITKKSKTIGVTDWTGANMRKVKSDAWWDNISGAKHEKRIKLTDDASLSRGIFYNEPTGQATTGYFGKLKKVPVIDIDLDDNLSHRSRQLGFPGGTFASQKKRALNNLFKLYGKSPQHKFRVDETKGGLRVFNLSQRTPPTKETAYLDKKLRGDPAYRVLSNLEDGFGVRLMRKPGRSESQVAKTIDMVGRGATDPRNIRDIKMYHDDLIRLIIQSSKDKGYTNMDGLFSRLLASTDIKSETKNLSDLINIIGSKQKPLDPFF